MGALILIGVMLLILIGMPLLGILALNILIPSLNIPFTFVTWFAMTVLILLFRTSSSRVSKS